MKAKSKCDWSFLLCQGFSSASVLLLIILPKVLPGEVEVQNVLQYLNLKNRTAHVFFFNWNSHVCIAFVKLKLGDALTKSLLLKQN